MTPDDRTTEMYEVLMGNKRGTRPGTIHQIIVRFLCEAENDALESAAEVAATLLASSPVVAACTCESIVCLKHDMSGA